MKPALFPTSMASKDNKKKWLVFELLRYRDFIKRTQTLKLVVLFGLSLGALSLFGTGWPVSIGLVVGLLVLDFHAEMLIFFKSRDFLLDMGEACFDVDSATDHDFRILMNRVENYLKTKDETKKESLYKSLEECYDGMKFKVDLTEALDDLKKGKVQEEGKN